ncbi:MAG: serine hydrolase domain-containing protein [Myxococcota bacterium]
MTRAYALAALSWTLLACKPAAAPGTQTPEPAGPSVVAADIDVSVNGTDEPKARAPENLQALLDEVRRRSPVPGLAAAVVDVGGTLAIGVSGKRRADEPGDLTTADHFHLGSDTKAMTALLAAILVEDGVLRWEMTMAEAFPEDVDGMDPGFREVTLTQLLRHRGGVVPNVTDIVGLQVRLNAMPPEEHRRAIVREVLGQKPLSTPGSKFTYSNFGYVIVGAAIEKALGTTWEDAMRARVFGPLKMDSCGFGPTAVGAARDQPWAHVDQGDVFKPVELDNPAFLGPAGTVHCSLEDWGAFASVFFEGSSFVSKASVDALTSAVPSDDNRGGGYALGWAVPDAAAFGLPVLTHDGSNTVNYASIVVMPTLKAAVMVAANAGGERAQKAVVATVIELVRRVRGPEGDTQSDG